MLKTIIFATILLMTSVLPAADLTVGTRLMLNEGFKVTKTGRNDYLLINDVEVFLVPCKVYVLHEPEPDFFNRGLLERVYVLEHDKKNMDYYKNNRWYVEKIINPTTKYSSIPNFYAKKVFAVEKISKTNKSYVRVIDRSNIRYVLLLPQNIEGTFTVLE